jgi:hypothetical protein
MEAFNTRRARFFKSTMFRRRFVSVFMGGAKRKAMHRKLDPAAMLFAGRYVVRVFHRSQKKNACPQHAALSLFLDERVSLLRHFSG